MLTPGAALGLDKPNCGQPHRPRLGERMSWIKIAENSVLKQQEMNKAFCANAVFGYLRRIRMRRPNRRPNCNGYNFWLIKLNSFTAISSSGHGQRRLSRRVNIGNGPDNRVWPLHAEQSEKAGGTPPAGFRGYPPAIATPGSWGGGGCLRLFFLFFGV